MCFMRIIGEKGMREHAAKGEHHNDISDNGNCNFAGFLRMLFYKDDKPAPERNNDRPDWEREDRGRKMH